MIKFLSCVILIFYVNDVAVCFPISNLFGNFNVVKVERPFHARFEIKTSLGNPSIIESLTNRILISRFDIKPIANGNSNIARNIVTVTPKQNEKTITTDTDTYILPFNGDNSITDVNTEAEFTTDFTTTEDYESTTEAYEEELLNRSGVSPEVLASLLG